jgi:glycosyltransferase involved in cell wall biosynthesis
VRQNSAEYELQPAARIQLKRKPNIGIVNSPIYSLNEGVFLDNHIRTLQPLCNEMFVITGNFPNRYGQRVHVLEIESGRRRSGRVSLATRILGQITAQTKLTLRLRKIIVSLDVVLFDIGEYRNLLPLIFARMLKRKTLVIHLGGNKFLESRFDNPSGWGRLIPPVQDIMLRICYLTVDRILCISQSIVKYGQLSRYKNKILVYGGECVDTAQFVAKPPPSKRESVVGYAGRHTPKKGLLNLVRAIPLVLRERRDVNFAIVGSGEQHAIIVREVEKQGVKEHVSFTPWIPDAEYPSFLNRLKIFVQPSYEEGLPVTLKEAMASGAIVLATAVGGISDLVEDDKTGFILRDNSPDCIAETIIKTMENRHLDTIAANARSRIETQCSYSAIEANWRHILESTVQK